MKLSLAIGLILLIQAFSAQAREFTIQSKAFKDQQMIRDQNVYSGFGCTGKNLSPDIAWKNAPEGTQSFAITLYDPDAPTGSGWWHWTLFNIPASVFKILEGASLHSGNLPPGSIEGQTDFGNPGYGGPCPPRGDKPHRYILTLYALKVAHLDLDQHTSGAMLGFFLNQNSLAKTQITAVFGR